MMSIKMKAVPFICAAGLSAVLVSGCAQNVSAATAALETVSAGTVTGQITAVDGNILTLSLGEYLAPDKAGTRIERGTDENGARDRKGMAGAPDGNGEKPSKPAGRSGDSDVPPADFPDGSGMPPADFPTDEVQGSLPRIPGFTASAEMIQVVIDDQTSIQIVDTDGQTASGSADELQSGELISVTVDSDGTASSLTLIHTFRHNGGGKGHRGGMAAETTAAV